MKKTLLIILCALFVASCYVQPIEKPYKVKIENTNIYRVIDEEAGVICWYMNGGLSCLPISETKLGGAK